MNNEQKKAFIAEGREANTIHGNHEYFWKLCVRFDVAWVAANKKEDA